MPLSEHERRLLDQIEQTLRAEDPALASSLRSARPQPRAHTQLALALPGVVIGFGAVLIAVHLTAAPAHTATHTLGIVCAVLGFLLIVGCCDVGSRAIGQLRRRRGHKSPA